MKERHKASIRQNAIATLNEAQAMTRRALIASAFALVPAAAQAPVATLRARYAAYGPVYLSLFPTGEQQTCYGVLVEIADSDLTIQAFQAEIRYLDADQAEHRAVRLVLRTPRAEWTQVQFDTAAYPTVLSVRVSELRAGSVIEIP